MMGRMMRRPDMMSALGGGGMQQQLAGMGVNGDNAVGHLTRGEVVIPRGVMNPKLMAAFLEAMDQAGQHAPAYVVGSPRQQINPNTNMPMFPAGNRGGGDGDAADTHGWGGGGGGHSGGGGGGGWNVGGDFSGFDGGSSLDISGSGIGNFNAPGSVDTFGGSRDTGGASSDGDRGGGGLQPITETIDVGPTPGSTVTDEQLAAGAAGLGSPGGQNFDIGGGPTFQAGGMIGNPSQWGAAHYDATTTGNPLAPNPDTGLVGTYDPGLQVNPSGVLAAGLLGPAAGLAVGGLTNQLGDPLSVNVGGGWQEPGSTLDTGGTDGMGGDTGIDPGVGNDEENPGAPVEPEPEPEPPPPEFVRPEIGAPSPILGLSAGMTPLQMRTFLATYGTNADSGIYRTDQAYDFYDTLLQNALINDDGSLNELSTLLPVELQYLQNVRGIGAPESSAALLRAIAAA